MPFESSAKWAQKLVKLPSGTTVPVRVRTMTSFIDPVDRGQETQVKIDNSAKGDRKVHVDQVVPSSGGHFGSIDVERIDIWKVLDTVDRGQETQYAPDNKTMSQNPPPYFITHKKTHIVRYKNDPDNGSWIDSEMIDEIDLIDPVDRGQQTNWTLLQPQSDDDAQVQDGDPDITDTDNGVDPPWRTDPFQNIVDFHDVGGGAHLVIVYWMDMGADVGIFPPTSPGSSDDHFVVTSFINHVAPPGIGAQNEMRYNILQNGMWPPADPNFGVLYGVVSGAPDDVPLPPSRGDPPTYGNRHSANKTASGYTASCDVYTTELDTSQVFYGNFTLDGSGMTFSNIYLDELGNQPNPTPSNFAVTSPPPGFTLPPGSTAAQIFFKRL